MSNNNISLDLDYVKAQFPAFSDPKSAKWSFFENAGGSYVPINVIEHLNHFMTSTKVSPMQSLTLLQLLETTWTRQLSYLLK